MQILRQIQIDLLDHSAPLSSVLRKARILAHELDSTELTKWITQELEGYEPGSELPDYRIIRTGCVGQWTNGYWMVRNHLVPVHKIEDENLKKLLTTFPVRHAIQTVENLAHNEREGGFILPPDLTSYVNHFLREDDYGFMQISYAVGARDFDQILDAVRNRLLDFILKLGENWDAAVGSLSPGTINGMVSVIIYNNPQGGSMTFFDQRGQQVSYQYNAAGNINISAVQTRAEFVGELEKLRLEVARAKESGVIDDDVAIEAEFHLLQASKEAKSDEPEKGSFFEHLNKARSLLQDVAAVAGLVTALSKIAEIASNILR